MSVTFDAVFDGAVLKPLIPIALEPNTRVRLTMEPVPKGTGKPYGFLDVALKANLPGPSDWSRNLDDYLYGGKDLPE